MESDGDHLQQQQHEHAEAAEEAMAMAAAAATAATSAAGAAENRDKGKTIWIPDEGPSNPTDDLMLDIDGDDLIFSDAAFSCLPDFPCLPSPAGSPSSSSACNPFHNTSLASSSSSSSSFLFAPDGGGSGGGDMQAVASSSNGERMMPSEVASDLLSMELEGLDILGDMGLFGLSEQWDPASLFPDNMTMNGAATAGTTSGPGPSPSLHAMAGEARPPGEAGVGGGVATGAPRVGPAEDPEEMARVFFEWMRINRDAISPQDLREIRMKRATIDCAVRHLGGNRQAQVQLLKLVLTWVQANHLLKKKRRRIPNEQQDRSEGAAQPPYPYHHHQQQQQQPFAPPNHHVPIMSSDVPVNPNPNLDYSYAADSQRNGWIPYHVDPTTGAAFPVMMPVYGGGGSTSGGEPAYPGPAATNYPYHRGSTSGIVLNGRPFDMHAADHTPAAWPSQYSAAPAQYVPFPGAAGPHPAPMPQAQYPRGFVNQYPGHALYQQGQQLGGMASATKEARKKRMARQRRASSLHSHRSQQQQQQNHHQAESSSSRAPAEGASSSSSNANNNNSNNDNNNNNNNNNRSWSFWSSTSSSRQKNPMMEAPPPPKSSMQQPQLSPSMPPKQQQQQQQNSHRDAASSADRRQGLKGEKNLRFLFQKVLKQSDVGSLGRIVLPKKEAEIHLPELEARDGMSIPMEDIGTSQVWNMRYRFWPNNKSRMYLLENTGEFVRSNGLQEGDFIVIYSDMKCGKYMIRGVKVTQQPERGQANRSVARSHLKRSSWERGSTSRMRGSSSHDGINDDPGMPSSSAASPFMIKMEASP